MTGGFRFSRTALAVFVAGATGLAAPVVAQSGDTVSRAVVQPLPPAAADDLNAALIRLARDQRDVDALVTAGLASLELNDVEAAIGFFGRAKELSPENARIAEGMGAAYVRGGRPIEALEFFGQADRAGIGSGTLWADRGLAYDLVGQSGPAQAAYRRALSLKDDAEVRQRLALSYAIAGDRRSFEEMLKPLLDARDFAAYRTRAFGLAVLGEADEAVEIARAVMPRDLAGRMEPYLRFMPRLTRSQQAAAANLGIYPSASRIGRDDPRIAGMAASPGGPATSDAALEPRGAALGTGAQAARPRPEVDARDPLTRTLLREPAQRAAVPVRIPPPTAMQSAVPTVAQRAPGPATEIAPTGAGQGPSSQPAAVAQVALGQPESRQGGPVAFDLADARPAARNEPALGVASTASAPTAAPVDLADAFADFAQPTTVAVTGGNVVDISAIEPPREEAAPEPPPAPRRIWLQLGIGQDRNLLRSDWRLKYRNIDAIKGKGPFVTPWGQTNRLLAGPFASMSDAREALNALAAAQIDSFVWTSAEGQAIDDLR